MSTNVYGNCSITDVNAGRYSDKIRIPKHTYQCPGKKSTANNPIAGGACSLTLEIQVLNLLSSKQCWHALFPKTLIASHRIKFSGISCIISVYLMKRSVTMIFSKGSSPFIWKCLIRFCMVRLWRCETSEGLTDGWISLEAGWGSDPLGPRANLLS